MVLQDLLAGGVEYVQDSQPSDADTGEIWLDTSVDPSALKIYDASSDVWDEAQASNLDAPVSNIQDELQSGRTRELLLLLQGKPIPDVQDPMNIVSSASIDASSDISLFSGATSTADLNTYNSTNDNLSDPFGNEIVPNGNINDPIEITIEGGNNSDDTTYTKAILYDSSGQLETKDISITKQGSFTWDINTTLQKNTTYAIEIEFSGSYVRDYRGYDGVSTAETTAFDVVNSGDAAPSNFRYGLIGSITATTGPSKSGYVTDKYASPTSEPADFKQWNAIQARGVTTGGSTSADPVEFEILDSSDTALNSTRIPKARIADEPFVMRNRAYSEDAGSDGQSDYQIATTGDGGHFGIPILTVVSVKKNGSVLDSDNWSFDGNEVVTIDTSNVTISSGDAVTISYDFGVFDSTLQPKAYLSREDATETSPSISHFRYEYVI